MVEPESSTIIRLFNKLDDLKEEVVGLRVEMAKRINHEDRILHLETELLRMKMSHARIGGALTLMAMIGAAASELLRVIVEYMRH